MKKITILMAIITILSTSVFALTPVRVESPAEMSVEQKEGTATSLYAATTAQRYFYQDFESLETGPISLAEISSLVTPTGDVTVGLGYIAGTVNGSYEICEENGNKYLKISGAGAVTLGAHFSDNQYRYSNMSFNYKYASAESAKPLVKFDECTNSSLEYYSDWSYINPGQTPTAWTHIAIMPATKGEAIGIGFHWENNSSYEVHIDDLVVWCDKYADADFVGAGGAEYQQVAVGFSAGSSVDATGVTMPKIGDPWEGFRTIYVPSSDHDSQKYSRVNLNNYIPTGTPGGYEFGGWSITDGGKKIKSNEYSDFRITGETTFYAIWEKREKVTITFENSTSNAPSEPTLPAALVTNKWLAESDNVNLDNYKATTTEGYEFAGWSLSDGGAVIETQTAFKPDSTKTLYAVWTKIVYSAVAYFEDFEDFEVNQELYLTDLGFIRPNGNLWDHQANDCRAGVVVLDDDGNKVLQVGGGKYGGFNIENRGKNPGTDHLQFDYKLGKDNESRAVVYAGASYSDAAAKAWLGSKKWKNVYVNTNSEDAQIGLVMDGVRLSDNESINGTLVDDDNNYELYIDNVYYWYVPNAEGSAPLPNVTITFTDSTFTPEDAKIDVVEFEYTLYSKDTDLIDFGELNLTTDDERFAFAGWSLTDGGKLITAEGYRPVVDQTLYAVWKYNTPEMLDMNSFRIDRKGLRFIALAPMSLAESAKVSEFGVVLTRKDLLDAKELTGNDITFDMMERYNIPVVSGACYQSGTNDDFFKIYSVKDSVVAGASSATPAISAVLFNIPEYAYKTEFVVRAYTKFTDGTYVYGNYHTANLYETVKSFKAANYDALDESQKAVVDNVLATAQSK